MDRTVAVEPLRCSSCGAFVPLGHDKHVRCPYCRTWVTVPPEYDALQRAVQSFAENRQLAMELYGRVGQPPGPVARAFARGFEHTFAFGARVGRILAIIIAVFPHAGLVLIPAVTYLVSYPVAQLVRVIFRVRGPLEPLVIMPPTAIGVAFIIGAISISLSRERVLAEVRRDIHASLAAAPPERPGGPSLCRNCGAALDVPKGVHGVPCAYCKADNLVALPEVWVAHVRSQEFRTFLRIDAALDAYRRALDTARERRWRLIFGLVVALPFTVMVAACTREYVSF